MRYSAVSCIRSSTQPFDIGTQRIRAESLFLQMDFLVHDLGIHHRNLNAYDTADGKFDHVGRYVVQQQAFWYTVRASIFAVLPAGQEISVDLIRPFQYLGCEPLRVGLLQRGFEIVSSSLIRVNNVSQSPNDNSILAQALSTASSPGRLGCTRVWRGYMVNNDAANLWEDYYLDMTTSMASEWLM
ncbi:uncharacterized protein F5147DRAFT_659586 [Suillus discolor]|uniref:Uncharacterized protein n=1 Tax=Suillus discolor TaxID=1912936 RepID=A0A9P7ES10_9AGAM|nr:uncharacterized protein F5147DRAFT_659586 [Suillus discolor]KAG2085233.1 hypothetical protein F5147DRAFT_659586 [Suillus discolor]